MGVAPLTLRFRFNPDVPMGYLTGVPYVCALGIAEALEARVRWPHDVVMPEGGALASVRARAGYDDEGVFVAVDVDVAAEPADGTETDAAALEQAARLRVDAWSDDVAAGRSAAGPLASVLSDYFDALLGTGGPVEVVRGGRVVARGTLAGVDVWGRATVRTDNGQELEVASEQATLRPA